MAKSGTSSNRKGARSAQRRKGKRQSGKGRVTLGQIVAESQPGEEQPIPAPHVPHEKIAERAYLKFLARGCVHGFHEQDWFEAERELIEEARAASKSS